VLLLLGLGTSSCYFNVKEIADSRGEGVYGFNPETVLDELARGETDVFVPRTATPRPALAGDLPPVRWTQADFYRLAQAFQTYLWPEPVERWQVDQLTFQLNCTDAPLGPQWLGIMLFRTAPAGAEGYDDGYDSRFERSIYFDPRQGTIRWWESRISPNMRTRPALDLDRLQVTAEQALQIAEQHGGEAARLAVENKCHIEVAIVGGLRGMGTGGWSTLVVRRSLSRWTRRQERTRSSLKASDRTFVRTLVWRC
jgi:hypothetical protein